MKSTNMSSIYWVRLLSWASDRTILCPFWRKGCHAVGLVYSSELILVLVDFRNCPVILKSRLQRVRTSGMLSLAVEKSNACETFTGESEGLAGSSSLLYATLSDEFGERAVSDCYGVPTVTMTQSEGQRTNRPRTEDEQRTNRGNLFRPTDLEFIEKQSQGSDAKTRD